MAEPYEPGLFTKVLTAAGDVVAFPVTATAQFGAGMMGMPNTVSTTPFYDKFVRGGSKFNSQNTPAKKLGAALADVSMLPAKGAQAVGNFLDPVEVPPVGSLTARYDAAVRGGAPIVSPRLGPSSGPKLTTREAASTYRGPTGPAGDMVAPTMTSAMLNPEVTRASTFTPENQLMRGRAVRTVGPDPKRPTLDEMIRANRGMSIDQLSALAQILPKPAAPRSPKDIIGTELYNSVQGGFLNDLASAQGDEQAMRAANEARYNKLLQIYVQQGLLPGLNLGLEE